MGLLYEEGRSEATGCVGRLTIMSQAPHRLVAPSGHSLNAAQVRTLVADACPADAYRGKKVLLIIPDATRTAPVGLMFQSLHAQIGGVVKKFDVMIALGTHPP